MKTVFSFSFSLFSKKVQAFHSDGIGIVIEKEHDIICIYATDEKNRKIFCALPLCHPKFLKGMTYQVALYSNGFATVSVADIQVYLDYNAKKCANNKGLKSYGSDEWGRDVTMGWSDSFMQLKGS